MDNIYLQPHIFGDVFQVVIKVTIGLQIISRLEWT